MSPLRPSLLIGALLLVGVPAQGRAQQPERPAEDALFGDEEEKPAPDARPPQPPGVDEGAREHSRDEEALGGPQATDAFESEQQRDDPMEVGGFFFLQAQARGEDGSTLGSTPFAAPTLVDGYFDARPTDRIRGFVVGRLFFDPTNAPLTTTTGVEAVRADDTVEPQILLDQAWLRFDIARAVFVTAGKQHMKWGVSRFWNPTDFLTPQQRDPLAVFDARTGASMLKLHVPWEARGWNFYAIALFDNAGPASSLGKVGGAARAELVLGPAEVGLGAVLQPGRRPRLGLDLSSAVGPFDVYAEAALKTRTDAPQYRLPAGLSFDEAFQQFLDTGVDPVEAYIPTGLTPQVSGGVSYDFAYSDTDAATVGVEYFYNATGYPSEQAYAYLALRRQFQPFSVGRHYGALYVAASGPGSWEDTSVTLSTLGNLSDRSFITRLDVVQRVLSDLSVNVFVSGAYGTKGGEFRFALDPFRLPDNPGTPEVDPLDFAGVRAPTMQAGVGLRVNI